MPIHKIVNARRKFLLAAVFLVTGKVELEQCMIIRSETSSDIAAIDDLTRRAFLPMAFSDGSEASIITALRGAGHLTLSLVAEEGGVIIGHIAFSPLTIGDAIEGWFSLGPVSVEPERQRSGIGRRLWQAALLIFANTRRSVLP
ncbi:GNAT family N-acetyltransferase [Rhizobium lusitanum]|uniref:GNAT family N-acetyltransferase n=1 Tax=Rhizobium lusitanum TaxID=293958 RepID=UPI0032B2F096